MTIYIWYEGTAMNTSDHENRRLNPNGNNETEIINK